MEKLTRRLFFKEASLGVATTGILAVTPALTTDSAEIPEATTPLAELSASGLPANLIAHVRDIATGEISLMVGTQEIVYRDPELVARLLRAVH